jgi:hypothetical protein
MAITDQEVREKLARFIGVNQPTILGVVKSVDKDKCTCDIDDDGIEWLGIRLRPITGINDGVVKFPKVGAYLLAVKIETSDEWMMVEATEYESILMVCEKIEVNGGENGGLVISQKTVDELHKTITRINAIVTSLTILAAAMTATASAPVLGAALGTAITSAIAGLQTPLMVPTASSLENEKFKH